MIEALKGEEIVRKIGGRFRLTALVQRRLKELMDGARPLVPSDGRTPLEVVVAEIMEDKIAVDYDRSEQLNPPDAIMLEQKVHGSEDSQDY